MNSLSFLIYLRAKEQFSGGFYGVLVEDNLIKEWKHTKTVSYPC
ncbi:hypothetical protein LSO4A_130025 [Candidatus Liberibacter solanacearum]